VITWNYSVLASAVEYLAKDQTKVESFTITLDDGNGGTVARTIDVTITGTNDGPVVAATDVTGAVTELVTPAGNLTDTGTIGFSDVDLLDTHLIQPTIVASAGALGALTASVTTQASDVDGTGGVITWNYSVLASDVEYLAAGQTKLETFTFDVLDGQGGTVARTVERDDHRHQRRADRGGDGRDRCGHGAGDAGGQPHRHGHDRLHRRGPARRAQRERGDGLGGCARDAGGQRHAPTPRQRAGWCGDVELQRAAGDVEYLAQARPRLRPSPSTCSTAKAARWRARSSVTITGTNDAPIVAATDVTGAVTELVTPAGNLTDTGTIGFTDVDLRDRTSRGRGDGLGGCARDAERPASAPTPRQRAWVVW
jgi:VCBS repeat-containing protein